MNSFRFLERGIEAELERQAGMLDGGGEVEQETLHFDPRTGDADAAALEGVRARLSLLPRARPGAAGADRGDARRRLASRCPSCPPSAASATRASSGSADEAGDPARLRRRARRLLRAGRASRPARSRRRRSRTGSRASSPRPCARSSRRGSRPQAGELGATIEMVQAKRISRGAGRQVLRAAGRRAAATRRRSSSARALARSRTPASSRRSSTARSSPTRRPPSASATATQRRSAPLVGFVMRETKGRADGGEVTRLIREKLSDPARADQVLVRSTL